MGHRKAMDERVSEELVGAVCIRIDLTLSEGRG